MLIPAPLLGLNQDPFCNHAGRFYSGVDLHARILTPAQCTLSGSMLLGRPVDGTISVKSLRSDTPLHNQPDDVTHAPSAAGSVSRRLELQLRNRVNKGGVGQFRPTIGVQNQHIG
jgi:hypothetical protein